MATRNLFTLRKPSGYTGNSLNVQDVDGVTSLYVNDQKIEAEALVGGISTITVSYAASVTTDGIEATYTAKDASGTAVSGIHTLNIYISNAASGASLTSTSASGALTAVTGTILSVLTAKKHIIANTDVNGVLKLLLVDSANTAGERFCATYPGSGKILVGAATVASNYEGGV